MNNLKTIYLLLIFIFYRPIISVTPDGLGNVKNEKPAVVEEIKRLQVKKRLARRRKNKKIKEIQDFVTTGLATVGLFSVGYIFYKMFFQEKPSGSSGPYGCSFFNSPEIFSPGTKTVKTRSRCLLFAVANALSWEPDFVWPEAGVADDETGKNLYRIEKARRIVKFLDIEFKKYADGLNPDSSSFQIIKKEANGEFVAADHFQTFFNNKFPELAKKYSYLIVQDTELSDEKYGCPLFLLRLFHNFYDANGRKTENFEVLSIPENKYTKVINEKLNDFSLDKSYRQTPINYSGDHSLGEEKMFKNKSIIVGDGSHYVCVHFDGKKLIQCNDRAPSSSTVWSSIKSSLENFFWREVI